MYKQLLNSLIIISILSINNSTKAQEIKPMEIPTENPNPINIQYSDTLNKAAPINIGYSDETSKTDNTNTIEKSSFSLKGLQIGTGIGVLGGANFQIGYRIPQNSENFWKNRFGFRIDYNTWSPLKNYVEDYFEDEPLELDDNEFSVILKGKQLGALIDFFPFGNTPVLGNIRFSAGYYTGDFSIGGLMTKEANEIFSMKSPNTSIDTFYKVNGKADLTATFDYDVKGPYAGLGFDTALFWKFKLYFDAGLVFTDKPNINTDITGTGTITICNDNTCASGNTVTINSNNEEIQKLLNDTMAQYKDELDDLRKGYFPIIKLGLLYRF